MAPVPQRCCIWASPPAPEMRRIHSSWWPTSWLKKRAFCGSNIYQSPVGTEGYRGMRFNQISVRCGNEPLGLASHDASQRRLYQFPPAPVTHPHRPGSIQQQKFVLSPFWRPQVQTQGVNGAGFSPEAPGEGPSCFFQLLGPQAFLGLWPHHPHLWHPPHRAVFLPGHRVLN